MHRKGEGDEAVVVVVSCSYCSRDGSDKVWWLAAFERANLVRGAAGRIGWGVV